MSIAVVALSGLVGVALLVLGLFLVLGMAALDGMSDAQFFAGIVLVVGAAVFSALALAVVLS